jgi:hypothetical protein
VLLFKPQASGFTQLPLNYTNLSRSQPMPQKLQYNWTRHFLSLHEVIHFVLLGCHLILLIAAKPFSKKKFGRRDAGLFPRCLRNSLGAKTRGARDEVPFERHLRG